MPFGTKPAPDGSPVEFDEVYSALLRPAIETAGLDPLRADEEAGGGIIHKPMFERLLLCPFAVADLTTANPNVFYELGVRHATRPHSTVLVFARGMRLPFDVSLLRAIPYDLDADGRPVTTDAAIDAIAARLMAARKAAASDRPPMDSPLFQLVDGVRPQEIDHAKTDIFRDRVEYSMQARERLAEARLDAADRASDDRAGVIRAVETELGSTAGLESGVVVDLFLSYRAVSAWAEMLRLAESMSPPLRQSVMIQEQVALAFNRVGQSDRAERVLLKLIEDRGPSSETLGILGRVYKDRWRAALDAGDRTRAAGFLDKAIAAYLRGFEADWRDAYPGINAVTLIECRSPGDPRLAELMPVVVFAVKRRMSGGTPDYWDHATLLELAVIARDESAGRQALAASLASIRESWEPETTAGNLALIRECRAARGEAVDWADEAEQQLRRAASL
jgi:hypothetical protein